LFDDYQKAHSFREKRKESDPENYAYVAESQLNARQLASSLNTQMLDLNVSEAPSTSAGSKRIKLEVKQEVKEEVKDEYDDVYDRYDFSRPSLPDLPIFNHSRQILEHLEQNNIIIIQGNTGCGKTTQVPQIIIDAARSQRKRCNILVTQPRRLATVTICQRVCQERNWAKGTVCGYHIGMEPRFNQDTRILYVTNAILKEKFIHNPSFVNNYTHIS